MISLHIEDNALYWDDNEDEDDCVDAIVSSDRSSCSDDGLVYIQWRQRPLFEIFTQSLDAIDVTSVTLSRLNSINAIDVTRY